MKIKMAKIFGILISVFVLFASCGQIADGGDVPQGYAKVRVSEPNGRAITAEEKQNSRFEYYFNDRKSESNETIAQVGSRLRIKVVAIDGRNGRQVATGEKTITVAAGTNNVDILLREDRGPYVNMVRWSAGVATVGSVENMPADESRSPGDVITVPQNPTWVYADMFNGWSYGNAQLVDENDSPISGNLTDGKKFKVPDGGVTLTAEWTPTQYTINYTTVDGSGSATGNFNATQSTVQLNAGTGFNNGGNILTKWQASGVDVGNPNGNISVETLISLAGGTQSITLTAKWEALTEYNVTFAEGDQTATSNTMPQATKSYIGGTISLSQKPTATGYEFKGWKVTKTDGGVEITTLSESDTQYTMPGEYAITLTAQWQVKALKVKYNVNAPTGSTPTGSVAETDRTYGSSFTLAQNSFSVQGYQFNGWFSAASGGQQVQGSSSTYINDENDIDVFAQWTAIDINVTLNAGSGTGTDSSTLKFNLTDASATLPQTTTFTKQGYTFAGWSYSDTGNTANTFDEIKTAIKENTVTLTGTNKDTLTLYVVWQAKTLKVKYNANAPQGSTVTGSVNDTDRTYGSSFTLAENGFSVQGYTFNGWYSMASGGQQVQGSSSTYMNNENDIDVFARWTAADINVTLNAGSGTGTDTQSVKFKLTDTSDTLPQITSFTKTGYKLSGWSYSNTGNTANTFDEIKAAIKNNIVTLTGTSKNELTLYAVWEAITYRELSAAQPCDVICANGKVLSASDITTTELQSQTIAVVYKVDIANKKVWAVGKVLSDTMKWADSNAQGCNINITDLQVENGYTDGSTGLGILRKAVGDATTDSELANNYPAWDYACNYGKNQGLTNFQTDWYLPSKKELEEVHNKKTEIGTALAKTGVPKTFGSNYYYSSSESFSNDATRTNCLFFGGVTWLTYRKDESRAYVCAVRQFTWY